MADGVGIAGREVAEAAPRRGRGFSFSPAEGGAARAIAALSTWSVQEALTPRTYGEPRDLVSGGWGATGPLAKGRLPWRELAIEPRKDYAFYHRIHLGSIDMRVASARIVEIYGREEAAGFARAGSALLGMALTDRLGAPCAKGLSVSSFGWALPLVLGRDLSDMGEWDKVEQEVLEHVSSSMSHMDEDDKPLPLTWDDVMQAHEYIVGRFGLPREMVRPPSFSLRIEHHVRAKSEPAPFILNSFYLRDIDHARSLVSKGKAPQALRAYMGADAPTRSVDVLTATGALTHSLSPAVTSHARWPSPGGHALVTLQQAAANAALAGLGAGDGILSVNGPPGTGKTTLLREIVAGCILRRAEAMAAFAVPADAFVKPEARDDGRQRRMPFHLHESLRGHEILVASSNNKAVENISRELPLARALGRDLSYFRTLSNALAGIGAGPDDEGEAEGLEPTWGLAAAVMGNAENRHGFLSTFWRDDDHGLRTWLTYARGGKVTVAIKDDKGRQLGSRDPYLLRNESPPRSPADAAARWASARARFLAVSGEVRAEFERLSGYERAVAALPGARKALDEALDALRLAGPNSDVLVARHARALSELGAAEAALAAHAAAEPFRGDGGGGTLWRVWDIDREEAESRVASSRRSADRLAAEIDAFSAAPDSNAREARALVDELSMRVSGHEAVVASLAGEVGDRTVDQAFYERGHAAWNVASPWMPDALHAKREELFAAALQLHEAFAGAAADALAANLASFVDANGSSGPPSELVPHLGHLWSSLFLVVPVVSTTFASVGRMLAGMGPDTLGWLVVDEAGQAVPQAAVGALYRCRRALVVGDPLQIEPVVTLPRKLTERICAHFGIAASEWAGPEASVQTLADAASPLKGSFEGERGPRRVGMPLLVHRRCQEPMFGISNRVAYAEQMVFASGPAEVGPVAAVLGPSTWFDVTGQHTGKWCYEQGDAVAELLGKLADAGVAGADVYVITPFRDVATSLQQRLRREGATFEAFGESASTWLPSRVGTIHTFQGREAEAVILVLGAGGDDHGGARAWVGSTPNIINVASSRAKRNIYVVGCRSSWEGTGLVARLAEALPVTVRVRPPEPEYDEDDIPAPVPRPAPRPGRLGALRAATVELDL